MNRERAIDKLCSVKYDAEEARKSGESLRKSIERGKEECRKVRELLNRASTTTFVYDDYGDVIESHKLPLSLTTSDESTKLITVKEMLVRKNNDAPKKDAAQALEDALFEKEDAKIIPNRALNKPIPSTSKKNASRQSRVQKTFK